MKKDQDPVQRGESCNCPQRFGHIGITITKPEDDHWRVDGTCSFCGSLHPDAALKLMEQGAEVTPTDKDYKVYIDGKKFYWGHFSEAQQYQFVQLYNERRLKLAFPGRFYVVPFFCEQQTRLLH